MFQFESLVNPKYTNKHIKANENLSVFFLITKKAYAKLIKADLKPGNLSLQKFQNEYSVLCEVNSMICVIDFCIVREFAYCHIKI